MNPMQCRRRYSGTRHRRKGFTLIEVLVAILILGIALTAIHYGQAQGLRAQARTQNITLATMLAGQFRNDFYLRSLEDMPRVGEPEEGVFDPPFDSFHFTFLMEENELAPEYVYDCNLTISWEEGAKKEDYSLSSRDGSAGKRLKICWLKLKL